MFVKNKKRTSLVKVLMIVIGLIIILLSAGCLTASTDEVQIEQIGKNIEKAFEKKDVDLFMQNISYDYSDSNGGTYDNHINNLPENIISEIEEAEELIDSFSYFLEIIADVSIPDDELVFADIYASGKMKIDISLKACIFWNLLCTTLYSENIEYNVDFIKEDDDWKIISLTET
jgi:hypothetical protein